ncbi:MAG: SDR family NAD(P)-dependent oxidoreductase [Bacteroidota bacterium]
MDSAYTLISGASSGIGLELARIHARNGDHLVLVARSESKLHELKNELERNYSISVKVIAKDLSLDHAPQEIYDQLQTEEIFIEHLINNAGIGDFDLFHESDWKKTATMIDLNMKSLTHMTRLFSAAMVNSGGGRIMNVASTASFQPGPLMSVYYATKHYVLAFSEGIANELKDQGVTVTALCPGPTESGFQSTADMGDSRLVNTVQLPTAQEVAEYGYRSMMKGKTVAIHGFMNKLMAQSVRFTPRKMVTSLVRKIQEEK